MRPLAELQKRALTAVKYQDLIAIALYAHSPSRAYRVATELDWYDGKVASCRFLALILRDFGIEKFRSFIRQKNPKAHQELCWCECHRAGDHDYFNDYFYDPEDYCGCECCGHGECLHAAHTFGYECEKCESDNEGSGRSCEDTRARITKAEKRREEAEEVPAEIVLPPGRVGRIAQRLFEVTERSYAVHVFESNEFRACSDGDSILISTRAVNDCDDDELALVISHELAHNLFDHSRESSERISGMIQGVSRAVECEGILWGIAYGALNHAFNRKADRNDELNADRSAVEIASLAGFDTSKAAKVFGQPQIGGGIFSTHPSAERRARNIS